MTTPTITSADGTPITYERSGGADAAIVVNTVAEDRAGLSALPACSPRLHRVQLRPPGPRRKRRRPALRAGARGGGLAAIVEAAGGRAVLVSGSAGCVLRVDAATALGDRITRLYLFEPPFIVNDGRPPIRPTTSSMSNRWSAAGDRSGAVE